MCDQVYFPLGVSVSCISVYCMSLSMSWVSIGVFMGLCSVYP